MQISVQNWFQCLKNDYQAIVKAYCLFEIYIFIHGETIAEDSGKQEIYALYSGKMYRVIASTAEMYRQQTKRKYVKRIELET